MLEMREWERANKKQIVLKLKDDKSNWIIYKQNTHKSKIEMYSQKINSIKFDAIQFENG